MSYGLWETDALEDGNRREVDRNTQKVKDMHSMVKHNKFQSQIGGKYF